MKTRGAQLRADFASISFFEDELNLDPGQNRSHGSGEVGWGGAGEGEGGRRTAQLRLGQLCASVQDSSEFSQESFTERDGLLQTREVTAELVVLPGVK